MDLIDEAIDALFRIIDSGDSKDAQRRDAARVMGRFEILWNREHGQPSDRPQLREPKHMCPTCGQGVRD
jgi:hypothetical protein